MRLKKSNIKNWYDVETEIKGFLAFNPNGSLKDLFEMQGTTFRTKYYRLKPDNYQFPNGTKKGPKPKKQSEKKTVNPARQTHVRAFRNACDCSLQTLYTVMEQNDIDREKVPQDWKENKKIYIELMVEAVNNFQKPKDETPKKVETMPKKVAETKPEKAPESKQAKENVKQAKIDALMGIAKMIGEIE